MSFTDKEAYADLTLKLYDFIEKIEADPRRRLYKVEKLQSIVKDHDQRLIEEIEREVIGEDNEKQYRFMDEYEQVFDEGYVAGRNQLRAEQRKKLAEYKI